MDPRMLYYYNRELQHLRDLGGEFAKAYPKIAGRLALDEFQCADPYVERLLEGFAFLAARVQLKLDAEFPQLTQHLLEMVYPHYLAPTPSMAVVQYYPDLNEGALADGLPIPRHTVLRGHLGKGEQTACEYRSAHEVVLWPVEVADARYFTREAPLRNTPEVAGARGGVRLRFRATAGLTFAQIALERLPLYLRGAAEVATGLYEQLLANTVAIVARPALPTEPWRETLPPSSIRRWGFDDEQAILPYTARSFQGYRLLHEYFALPERFLFVELGNLQRVAARCDHDELEIFIFFDRIHRDLERRVDASALALFCTPAVNLFPRRADRIHLTERRGEYHVVPDRTRPMDFEVYQITEVVGHGAAEERQSFLPFYATWETKQQPDEGAYYSVYRVPRMLSEKQRRVGPRSSYLGSEVWLSLVDAREAPFRHDLRQLSLNLLCTNRDLPLHMPLGQGRTDFTLETSAPIASVRCVAGPTKPRPSISYGPGEVAWRLINHLSLNYASLMNEEHGGGAAALRELLELYAETSELHVRRQIDGVRSIESRPITRPLTREGPMSFARGLAITLTCDDDAFEGGSVFLLSAVLEHFFAKYVSLNSFTETVVRTSDRGEIMRWPARIGRRQLA